MKRMMIFLCAIGIVAMSSTCLAGMSSSRVRKETRFLTDKMAYELNLSNGQYNDAYEINYDFIYSIRDLMDDVVRGYEWALDRYYRALDIRNDDLRWVLSSGQYRRFIGLDYFYRPIYASGGRWSFRIYINYTNHNHFYFGKPYHYNSYRGGHCRVHYDSPSYYRGRYHHDFYTGRHSVRDDRVYRNNRRSDFGSVTIRPNTSTRPGTSERPDRPGTNVRPGTPAIRPDRPAVRPDKPAVRPGTPATRPDAPATRPGTPADRPNVPATRPDTPSSRPGTSVRPGSNKKEEVKRENDGNRRGQSSRRNSSSGATRKESSSSSVNQRSESSSRRGSSTRSSVSGKSSSTSSGRSSSRSSEKSNTRQNSSRSSERENGGRR